MNAPQAITLKVGDDGIAIATMDLPGRTMNVVNDALMQPLGAIVETVAADPAIKGLVLTSAKADFCAGGDLDRIWRMASAQEAFDAVQEMKAVLRRMETCGKPVVAAINGHALGGGLEIALACHARIVIDDPRLRLGQPEVKLGLLPGGGGTVRLLRLVGIQAALQICGEGADIAPQKALAMGLVTELARDLGERDPARGPSAPGGPFRFGVRRAERVLQPGGHRRRATACRRAGHARGQVL